MKELLAHSWPKPDKPVDWLFVAGEHSGDEHAARLIADIKAKNPEANIYALGGPEMAKAGATLLMDMTSFSVVGFVEVIKNYGFFKDLMQRSLGWIREHKPHGVCFVDYPGFNLRLAKELNKEGLAKKAGGEIALAYYIGPQIWAWKAKRRFAMAKLLDSLGVIFPFEVECFADTDLPTHFVGHPFAHAQYKNYLEYSPQGDILLLPGSRRAPTSRILPALLDAFRSFCKKHGEQKATILYPSESMRGFVKELLEKDAPDLVGRITLKPNAEGLTKARAVLTTSGTVSLNCALAGIPGAIVYRAHPVTYCLGRWLAKVPYLGIANLLLKREVYPEYIQGDASAKRLSTRLEQVCTDKDCIAQMQKDSEELRAHLVSDQKYSALSWIESL